MKAQKTLESSNNNTQTSLSSGNSHTLFTILRGEYLDREYLAAFRDEFLMRGYVKLPGLLSPEAFTVLAREVNLMREIAVDRSFVMPGVETPRELSILGGRVIANRFPRWLGLYAHHEIVDLLTTLTKGPVYACEHEEEFLVANFLNRRRGTHGWHLDDPAYALILFFEAPREGEGGSLEFIPQWREYCKRHGHDPEKDVTELTELARKEGLVAVRHHVRGDAYLLRADKCLHRVAELKYTGVRRAAINMAYQNVRVQTYGKSATALYVHPLAPAA